MTRTDDKPLRIAPRIKAAPKIRQLYWCDFPLDAHLPEFWKTRPVLIVSYRNTLGGVVTVIPCSTVDQSGNEWAVKLSMALSEGEINWAICDKLASAAVSRLSLYPGPIKRLPEDEFNQVLGKILKWLPKPPQPPT